MNKVIHRKLCFSFMTNKTFYSITWYRPLGVKIIIIVIYFNYLVALSYCTTSLLLILIAVRKSYNGMA